MRDRNKRRLIIYGLIGALTLTTVAYATLQTVLNISGTVVKKGNLWNIYFTNPSSASVVGSATGGSINIQASSLTFSVNLYKPGDKVTYTVDVKNGGTVDATLNSISLTGLDTAKSNNVNYSVTYSDSSSINTGDLLNIGSSKTLKIVVEYDYNATSISSSDINLTFGVTLIYNQTSTGSSSSSGSSGITSNNIIAGIYGNSVQNGTPSTDSPVAIQNVGDKTKNLFDYSKESPIYGYKDNGKFKSENLSHIAFNTFTTLQNYIGETVTISFDLTTSDTGTFSIYQYQSNGIGIKFNRIEQSMQANVSQRISVIGPVEVLGTNENYSKGAIIIHKNGYTGSYTVENIQFELNDTATDYEPYGYKIPITVSNGTTTETSTIYLNEPLRKVGEYADYLDLQTGKVTRNIKEIVFTGSENWIRYGEKNTFYVENNFIKHSENIMCYSNKYKGQQSGAASSYSSGNMWIQSTSEYPRIYISDDNYTSITSFKSYLASNNVIGHFVLDTPTEETVEISTIPSLEGNITYIVGTSISPSNINYSYK